MKTKQKEIQSAETVSVSRPGTKRPQVVKSVANRNWLWLAAGGASAGIGVFLGSIWLADPLNPIGNLFGLLTIVCFAVAGFFMVRGFRRMRGASEYIVLPGEPLKGRANTINIIAAKEGELIKPERIEFANVEKPTGVLVQLINDGKFYYVNWVLREGGAESYFPATLPDNVSGLTPKDFITAVGRPAFKAWAEGMNTNWNMQKIGVGILVGVLVIEILGIVIVG